MFPFVCLWGNFFCDSFILNSAHIYGRSVIWANPGVKCLYLMRKICDIEWNLI